MLALRDLQTAFRQALVDENESALETIGGQIADSDLSANERLAIHRNNIFASLSEALKETFPVICRLVDERFFSYAAHEFIVSHLPGRPELSEYGSAFPAFLVDFPPCRDLAYLADVAKLEWLMNVAAHAADAEPISPESFGQIAPEDAVRLRFGFHSSHGYLASPFPVADIWRANQTNAGSEALIDISSGGVRLEVSRQGGDVVFRALDETAFAFREALSRGSTLGAALEHAFAIEPDFATDEALAALFAQGAISAVALSPSDMEHTP